MLCHDRPMIKAFSARLRLVVREWQKRREAVGERHSQNELERLSGLGPGHLSMLKKGEREDPTLATLAGLVAASGCRAEFLLLGTGDPFEDGAGTAGLERAVELGADRWHQSTVDLAATLGRVLGGKVRTVDQWFELLDAYDQDHRPALAGPADDNPPAATRVPPIRSGTRPKAGSKRKRRAP